MSTPGFDAEASIYKTGEQYRIASVQKALGRQAIVFPQMGWVSACDVGLDRCLNDCYLVDKQCVNACDDAWALCTVGPGFP
jgi:hypothetical protein